MNNFDPYAVMRVSVELGYVQRNPQAHKEPEALVAEMPFINAWLLSKFRVGVHVYWAERNKKYGYRIITNDSRVIDPHKKLYKEDYQAEIRGLSHLLNLLKDGGYAAAYKEASITHMVKPVSGRALIEVPKR